MTESAPNPAAEAPVESLQSWSAEPQAGWTSGAGAAGADGAGTTGAGSGAAWAAGPRAGFPSDAAARITKLTSERPELLIAAAFAGGLLLATIIKRLGS